MRVERALGRVVDALDLQMHAFADMAAVAAASGKLRARVAGPPNTKRSIEMTVPHYLGAV